MSLVNLFECFSDAFSHLNQGKELHDKFQNYSNAITYKRNAMKNVQDDLNKMKDLISNELIARGELFFSQTDELPEHMHAFWDEFKNTVERNSTHSRRDQEAVDTYLAYEDFQIQNPVAMRNALKNPDVYEKRCLTYLSEMNRQYTFLHNRLTLLTLNYRTACHTLKALLIQRGAILGELSAAMHDELDELLSCLDEMRNDLAAYRS